MMDKETRKAHMAAYCYDFDHTLDGGDLESKGPRIGNRSDALDLCETLIELVKNDTDKKVWYGLKPLYFYVFSIDNIFIV
ncbi:hypothetical protein FACS1894110_09420 [Spirochaetia bacterium]|nr:hypothetical protein FACS1894110_09420 [Spirochaetia bacterium]